MGRRLALGELSARPGKSAGHYVIEWRRKGGEGDGGGGKRCPTAPAKAPGWGWENQCFNPSAAAPLSPCSLVTVRKEGTWEGQGPGGRLTHGAEAALG